MTSNNQGRTWKILNWNIRGINSDAKWEAIRNKVAETQCDIICLQETKREFFDDSYIRNFCPPTFDKYEYLPSNGASGGCITLWQRAKFEGFLEFINEYGLTVKLQSQINNSAWVLTNIYAPCQPEQQQLFLDWFQNIDMPDDCN